jgi:hypothetical protein
VICRDGWPVVVATAQLQLVAKSEFADDAR